MSRIPFGQGRKEGLDSQSGVQWEGRGHVPVCSHYRMAAAVEIIGGGVGGGGHGGSGGSVAPIITFTAAGAGLCGRTRAGKHDAPPSPPPPTPRRARLSCWRMLTVRWTPSLRSSGWHEEKEPARFERRTTPEQSNKRKL